jgi:hypothetical protein
MGATSLVGAMAMVSLVEPGEPAKPTVGFRLQDYRGAWSMRPATERSSSWPF